MVSSEKQDDMMYSCLHRCLRLSGEGSMCEFDNKSGIKDPTEQPWWLVALSDGACGDVSKFPSARLVQGEGLGVPAGDVIEPGNIFGAPQRAELFGLL